MTKINLRKKENNILLHIRYVASLYGFIEELMLAEVLVSLCNFRFMHQRKPNIAPPTAHASTWTCALIADEILGSKTIHQYRHTHTQESDQLYLAL